MVSWRHNLERYLRKNALGEDIEIDDFPYRFTLYETEHNINSVKIYFISNEMIVIFVIEINDNFFCSYLILS